jgi:antitoxin (DNA-binding transcriptional repressor) of toxin-antitoxin stability system
MLTMTELRSGDLAGIRTGDSFVLTRRGEIVARLLLQARPARKVATARVSATARPKKIAL